MHEWPKFTKKAAGDAGILAIRAHEKCTILEGEISSLLYINDNYESLSSAIKFCSLVHYVAFIKYFVIEFASSEFYPFAEFVHSN